VAVAVLFKPLMMDGLLGNDGGDVFGIVVVKSLLLLLVDIVFGDPDDNTDEEVLNADNDEGETEDLCFCRFCSLVVSASW